MGITDMLQKREMSKERFDELYETIKVASSSLLKEKYSKFLNLKTKLELHEDPNIITGNSFMVDPKNWAKKDLELNKSLKDAELEYQETLVWFREKFPEKLT